MFISVIAFRQSTSTYSPTSALPPPETELIDFSTPSSVPGTASDECLPDEEASVACVHSRRTTSSRILPVFITFVPIRPAISSPSIESSTIHRHSISARPRFLTIGAEPSLSHVSAMKNLKGDQANTIVVPLQTAENVQGSIERIHQPIHLSLRAPIASMTENNEEENRWILSLSSAATNEVNVMEESVHEKHWLLNNRFLLFCLSNFALCLVMGVPYVIIPTYISETFGSQGYLAPWTLSNVGIASALGQILLGYLHDRKTLSAWLMYTLAVTISGVSLIILALFRYKLIVLTCGFIYGLAISANYALQLLIVIDALSMDNVTNGFGILQLCQGVSTLIGIPIQGT